MDERFFAEKATLNNKFEQMDLVLQILKKANDDTCQEKILRNPDTKQLIKAALILMFYNAIEGTMNNLMHAYFNTIINRNLKINNLPKELQKLYCKNHLKIKKTKAENFEDELKTLLEKDIDKVALVDYRQISKNMTLFSGNLDSQGIINASKLIGVNLDEQLFKVSSLKSIKDKRNALAHGDIEFKEACSYMTVQDMETMHKDLHQYLINLITAYENAIEELIQENS